MTEHASAIVKELASRQCEAMKIFRATEAQSEFFRCTSREILCRGGNRSSKTTITAARFAAIATNQPIYDHKGRPIEMRQPWQKDRPLRMWVIGYQSNHIGQTIHRMLFRAGAFRMIRDKKTNLWRTYKPWEEPERECEAKPAPPFIPPRFIKDWTWDTKSDNTFVRCGLIDGTEIYAFTSTGEPKAGDPVDEIWIDEAIMYPRHYAEWQARLPDVRGRMTWSSWPRITNNALINLTNRARACAGDENPGVKEFLFTFSGNPFIDPQAKREAIAGWSPDERRARDSGEYLTDNLLMYHQFSANIHRAICLDEDADDNLSRILRARGGQPPLDWTRYLILDPGTAHPAILFAAVPPIELGDYIVPYAEIFIPRKDADQLAVIVKQRTSGQHFQRFIADPHAIRMTPMGFGGTIGDNYSRAFHANDLRCIESGSSFTPGSDNVLARIAIVQSWLTIQSNGFPKLRIVVDNCPNLVSQLSNYSKDTNGEIISEKPAKNQIIDLAVTLEYLASRNPTHIPPPNEFADLSPAHRYLMRLRARRKERQGEKSKTVHVGPGLAEAVA